MMEALRLSTPKDEGVLQVSKWLKVQVLLDIEEMRDLISSLSPIYIAVVSEPVQMHTAMIDSEEFLALYGRYVEALKEGRVPDPQAVRRAFSSVWSASLDALYAMSVGSEKYLVKAIRPTIQLQGHQFFYSTVDRKFHPMVLSKESISWGIQFAYPQLFQDPQLKTIAKVIDSEEFPNTRVFAQLMRWMREHTLPTPFVVGGERTNSPIRIGRQCGPWIDAHPQLRAQGIEVAQFQRTR
jgi:hypothetical protein